MAPLLNPSRPEDLQHLRRSQFDHSWLALAPGLAIAQATWQPTPAPVTTAENEAWYRSGEPIPWGDEVYYQAGAAVFFNRYQMVRSGWHRGIGLYTDSTQDAAAS